MTQRSAGLTADTAGDHVALVTLAALNARSCWDQLTTTELVHPAGEHLMPTGRGVTEFLVGH